jgi:glycosyltransferase involved in cell wall biosynthesis
MLSSKLPDFKFAVVSHTLPPSQNGQAVMLGRILKGIDPASFCLISTGVVNEPATEPARIRLAPSWRTPVPPIPLIRLLLEVLNAVLRLLHYSAALARSVREQRCNVLVACSGEAHELPGALLAARRARVAFVPYMFDWYACKFDYMEGVRGKLIRRAARWLEGPILRRAKSVIVTNQRLAEEYWQRYGVVATVVHNPTDLPVSHDVTGQATRDGPLICYFGAVYQAHYGAFRSLLQAMQMLPTTTTLRLYTNDSRESLAAAGIAGAIEIVPRVPPERLPALMREADVLFLPLAFDSPFPQIIETASPGKLGDYLTSGRPILVNAPPKSFLAQYCRRHECGLVVDSPAPQQLASALQRLLHDKGLCKALCRNASDRVSIDFSIDENQRRFLKALTANKSVEDESLLSCAGEQQGDRWPLASPRVSVVIPTYNRRRFVAEAVESALAQDYPDLEVIVVDDGSSDGTAESLSRFGCAIRYVRQENRGASAARNHGIRLATGEYIAFLDSDDLYLPDKVRSQVDYFQRHPDVLLLGTWYYEMFESGQRELRDSLLPGGGYWEILARAMNLPLATPTVMIRASAVRQVGGFDEALRLSEDQDLFTRVARLGPVAVLEKPLVTVRRHAANTIGAMSAEDALAAWQHLLNKAFDVDERLPRRIRRRALARAYFSAWAVSRRNGRTRWTYWWRSALQWPFQRDLYAAVACWYLIAPLLKTILPASTHQSLRAWWQSRRTGRMRSSIAADRQP